MPQSDAAPSYSNYLSLDRILSSQHARSDRHDEMLFIIVHQVYELWFKQILHELTRLQKLLEAGSTTHALMTLGRVLGVLRLCVTQLEVLETMTPHQFAAFRDRLGSSSGFDSAQFRELEAVLGLRDPAVAGRYREGSQERSRIVDAMSRPSVHDSLLRYLEKHGHTQVTRHDVTAPLEPSAQVQQMLLQVYAEDSAPVAVCEALVDLDEAFLNWRFRHAAMVERIIGAKTGTAGTSGVAYLRSTAGRPAFPDLWAVRTLV